MHQIITITFLMSVALITISGCSSKESKRGDKGHKPETYFSTFTSAQNEQLFSISLELPSKTNKRGQHKRGKGKKANQQEHSVSDNQQQIPAKALSQLTKSLERELDMTNYCPAGHVIHDSYRNNNYIVMTGACR